MSQHQVWEVPEEKPKIEIPVVCLNCRELVDSKAKRCPKCGAKLTEKTVAKDYDELKRITLEKKKKMRKPKANGLIVLLVFLALVFWLKMLDIFAPMLFGG